MIASPASVDVIVPCHNGARFLREALTSALDQTHGDTTVFVVDDGSTDQSAAIARAHGGRVRVIQQPQRGVSVARNVGIEAGQGAYIAFLDADDRWHREKLARQLTALADDRRRGLAHTAIRHIDETGRVTGRPINADVKRQTQGQCLSTLLTRNSLTTSSVLVRRDVLGVERFPAGLAAAEDWDLWLRLAARTQVAFVDEELVDYRFHDHNTVHKREQMFSGELTVMNRTLRWLSDPAHRRMAQRRRSDALADIANLAYESGDVARARRLLLRAGIPRGSARLKTFAASFLPDAVRRPTRLAWRRLHGPSQ